MGGGGGGGGGSYSEEAVHVVMGEFLLLGGSSYCEGEFLM